MSGKADASWWLLDPGGVDGRGEWRAGRWSSWNPGILWIAEDFFGLFENEVLGVGAATGEEDFHRRLQAQAEAGMSRRSETSTAAR